MNLIQVGLKPILHQEGYIADVALSPDGSRIAACGYSKDVYMWTAEGQALQPLQGMACTRVCKLVALNQ